jgi:hypothetical protein
VIAGLTKGTPGDVAFVLNPAPKTSFRIQLTLEKAFQKEWRGWMGIEPTQDASAAPRKRF